VSDLLYDKAFQFKKAKLWTKLWDTQIFAVKHSDGTVSYCCVMGRGGTHFALAAYPGDSGLRALVRIYEPADGLTQAESFEKMWSQDCLMLSFEDVDDLHPWETAELKKYFSSHHIVPRGRNAYPSVARFRPNHIPWKITDAAERVRLMETIDAALDVSDKLKGKMPEDLGLVEGFSGDKEIPLLTKRDGGFRWTTMTLPLLKEEAFPVADQLNDIAIAKILQKRNASSGTWICDIIAAPAPVQENPGKAPFYPLMEVILAKGSGLILGMEMQRGDGDYYAVPFTEKLCSMMLASGCPDAILVCNERALAFYSELARRLKLKLKKGTCPDELADMFASLYGPDGSAFD